MKGRNGVCSYLCSYMQRVLQRSVIQCVRMPTIIKPPRRPWLPERKPHAGRKNDNSAVYNSTRWRKARLVFLNTNPLCVACGEMGSTVAATVVDHIIPINQGGSVWSTCNWQALCKACHDKKSAREAHGRKASEEG